ncbi:baseplate wedge subunit and tail pin [Klebsiella phage vB_KpnM_VPA32]|nr:baseplate wedge subunit and tail pin [Klebsiella phage vB_KpnM_VPA32]
MKQDIKIGQAVDDGSGDYLRKGGQKINDNFDELYYELGDGDVPFAAGAWKNHKTSTAATLNAEWGKAYVLDTSTGRLNVRLPKGTANDYNKVIRLRDVYATWQVNPITIIPGSGDTLKGDSRPREIRTQFADLEMVYCPPGRWEYVENKQINRISNSELSTVVRKEFLVKTNGQTDFPDVFSGTEYNIGNTQVFHRGNILYYGEKFSATDSDFGSIGPNGTRVALDGKSIKLKNPANAGDTVIVVSYLDGISQFRSSYNRRSVTLRDSSKTNQTSIEGSLLVDDLKTLRYFPLSAFGIDSFSPVNHQSMEVRFNGILQNEAGTAGLPLARCIDAIADDAFTCQALGGTWQNSKLDYVLDIDDNNKLIGIETDREMEDGDIITLTWYNNQIGTVMELEDILNETDAKYVSKGEVLNLTGQVRITNQNKPGWPNVAPEPAAAVEVNNVQNLFDLVYPIGTIYENAVNPNNPATYMGFGTWVLWGQGKVVAGWNNDTTDPNFAMNNNDLDVNGNPSHTAGGTGGVISNELENAQIPASQTTEKVLVVDPNGPIVVGGCQFDPNEQGPAYTKYRESVANINPTHTPPKSVTNIQPYVTAYRWLRVS